MIDAVAARVVHLPALAARYFVNGRTGRATGRSCGLGRCGRGDDGESKQSHDVHLFGNRLRYATTVHGLKILVHGVYLRHLRTRASGPSSGVLSVTPGCANYSPPRDRTNGRLSPVLL